MSTAVLLLAACGDDSSTANDSPSPALAAPTTQAAPVVGVAVDGVWARTSPSMARAGAVYLTVSNPGDQPDALVGATVDASVAARIELHEIAAAGEMGSATTAGGHGDAGMMTMQHVDRVEIAAGATVALAPGGYHLMLFDLTEPLVEGDRFDVTLSFEHAGDVTVTADVRDSAP